MGYSNKSGNKITREFMCETPNEVNHLMMQLAAISCGSRGLGERARWETQEVWGCGWA